MSNLNIAALTAANRHLAELAVMQAEIDAAAMPARYPTGEPCRCPEALLDCVCGAYTRGDTRL
jgi:hypothetical protein